VDALRLIHLTFVPINPAGCCVRGVGRISREITSGVIRQRCLSDYGIRRGSYLIRPTTSYLRMWCDDFGFVGVGRLACWGAALV